MPYGEDAHKRVLSVLAEVCILVTSALPLNAAFLKKLNYIKMHKCVRLVISVSFRVLSNICMWAFFCFLFVCFCFVLFLCFFVWFGVVVFSSVFVVVVKSAALQFWHNIRACVYFGHKRIFQFLRTCMIVGLVRNASF